MRLQRRKVIRAGAPDGCLRAAKALGHVPLFRVRQTASRLACEMCAQRGPRACNLSLFRGQGLQPRVALEFLAEAAAPGRQRVESGNNPQPCGEYLVRDCAVEGAVTSMGDRIEALPKRHLKLFINPLFWGVGRGGGRIGAPRLGQPDLRVRDWPIAWACCRSVGMSVPVLRNVNRASARWRGSRRPMEW